MPLPMHKMLLQRYSFFEKGCRKKVCTRQSRMVIWDMTNTLFHCSCQTYFCCFPLALANIYPWPLVLFFQISLKNSELKTTHNTYRDCHVHFFGQPFSKQLYIEDVSKFHQEALTITAVLAILVGPLSSFSPCPSLPSVATDDCRKHIQCLLFCLK